MKEELNYPDAGSCQRHLSQNQSIGAIFAIYITVAFEVKHEFQTDDAEMTNQGDRMAFYVPIRQLFLLSPCTLRAHKPTYISCFPTQKQLDSWIMAMLLQVTNSAQKHLTQLQ